MTVESVPQKVAPQIDKLITEFCSVIVSFDNINRAFCRVSFDDLFAEGIAIIFDEARYYASRNYKQIRELDDRWFDWSCAMMKRLNNARPDLIFKPDSDMLCAFLRFVSVNRAKSC